MPAADDAAVVHQVEPVLDARQAVGDLAEVAPAELLLAVEVERAVVGRHDLEVVRSTRPVHSSGWWSFVRSGGEQTNFAPSNPLPRSSSDRNRYCGQVSAKAIAPRSRAARTCVERVARREMDDVHGHAGGLRQPDDPVRRLALEDRVAGQRRGSMGSVVPAATRSAATTSIAGPFSACIMIRPPFFAVRCIARKIAPSSREEDARVGGEQLEVGHALGDERVHLGQGRVVDVAHDHVEAVVDDGVALGLGVPGVEALAQRLAARLDREVDDRRRPAERRRARPGLERVLGERPAERQLHVGVDVDRAGDHVACPTRRSSRRRSPRRPSGRAPIAAIVSPSTRTSASYEPDGGDDRAVRDERAHPSPPRDRGGLARRPGSGGRPAGTGRRPAYVEARACPPVGRDAVRRSRAGRGARTRHADSTGVAAHHCLMTMTPRDALVLPSGTHPRRRDASRLGVPRDASH